MCLKCWEPNLCDSKAWRRTVSSWFEMSFEQQTLCCALWALHVVSSCSREHFSFQESNLGQPYQGLLRIQVLTGKEKRICLSKPLPQSSGQFENYNNFSVPRTNQHPDFWTRRVRANLNNYSGYLALYSLSIQSCKKWTSVFSLCSEHWWCMDMVSCTLQS